MDKELKVIVKEARKQGWTVEETRNQHIRFISPSGAVYIAHKTASDHRGIKNMKAHLRRLGWVDRRR